MICPTRQQDGFQATLLNLPEQMIGLINATKSNSCLNRQVEALFLVLALSCATVDGTKEKRKEMAFPAWFHLCAISLGMVHHISLIFHQLSSNIDIGISVAASVSFLGIS